MAVNEVMEMMTDENAAEFPDGATIEETDQPLHVKLRYGTELHTKILDRLNARRKLSEDHIKTRYDAWDQVDEHVRCYIDLDRKRKRADGTTDADKYEMPFQYAVVVPFSYTVMTTRQTGMMSILTNRQPVIQLEARGDEDVRSVRGLETMIGDYDWRATRGFLTFYALCQDVDKYGLGAIYDTFEEEQGWMQVRNPIAQNPMVAALLKLLGMPAAPFIDKFGVVKEYNSWSSADPYNLWPDPRVPLSCIKQMEFIGHTVNRSYLHFLAKTLKKGGPYFNIDQINTALGTKADDGERRNQTRSRNRNNPTKFTLDSNEDDDKGFYMTDLMQVKLIPRQWKLAPEEDPQIWQFAWLNEKLIVQANPQPFRHGQFSYSIAESNFDPHTLFNPGIIENLDGMQRIGNWMYNSHLENLIRYINNASIYGPSYIEEDDILSPGPAGHKRLTAAGEALVARGYSISQFYQQEQVADLTRGHLQELEVVFDMIQRMAAINDPSMGQPTQSKRTLGEIQRLVTSQQQRIGLTTKVIDEMAILPLVERAIANRQQFTTTERYYRIVGEYAKQLENPQMWLGRNDIMGNYDYVGNTGTLPPEPERFAEVWTQIMIAMGKIPQLFDPRFNNGKVLNPARVFDETVRTTGIKGFDRFYELMPIPPVRTLPDGQVQQEAKAGNLVPVEQGIR
jgi:hypothetical protein